jgi:hypothetical protein
LRLGARLSAEETSHWSNTGRGYIGEPGGDAAASRSRANYALRGAGRSYRLDARFPVNSGGQPQYDGVWGMDEIFDP